MARQNDSMLEMFDQLVDFLRTIDVAAKDVEIMISAPPEQARKLRVEVARLKQALSFHDTGEKEIAELWIYGVRASIQEREMRSADAA